DVDVIRGQAAQALLQRLAHEGGGEILRQLSLATAGARVRVEVVAELGGDDDAVALAAKGAGEDRFSLAIAVGVGRIVVGDPEVAGAVKQAHRLALRPVAPPSGADRPAAKADLRDLDVRV